MQDGEIIIPPFRYIIFAYSRLIQGRCSIDTPSILHRWSIVSMEYRWTNDGQAMEYHRKSEGVTKADAGYDGKIFVLRPTNSAVT